jgi:hypothetical protein
LKYDGSKAVFLKLPYSIAHCPEQNLQQCVIETLTFFGVYLHRRSGEECFAAIESELVGRTVVRGMRRPFRTFIASSIRKSPFTNIEMTEGVTFKEASLV